MNDVEAVIARDRQWAAALDRVREELRLTMPPEQLSDIECIRRAKELLAAAVAKLERIGDASLISQCRYTESSLLLCEKEFARWYREHHVGEVP